MDERGTLMKGIKHIASVLALVGTIGMTAVLTTSCAVNRGPSAEELAAIEAERQRAIEESLREKREEESRLESEARKRAEAQRLAAEEEARRIAEEESRLAAEKLHKEKMSLTTIYFEYDKSNVRQNQRSMMDENARKLREYQPEDLVIVAGHCDERGTIEYNLALGERRAQAVKIYLVDSGVESNRIETVSYGEEKPAVTGNNESAWSMNRRVELKRK